MLTFYILSTLTALVCSAISCWPAAIVFAVIALGVCFWAEARSLLAKRKLRTRRNFRPVAA